MKALVLVIGLLLVPAAASAESNFASVKLPRGVQLQIPKGWWLMGKDHNRLIHTSVEAALDLSGIGLPDGQETNLIAANSMPRTTYAVVRVDSTIPPSVSPREIQAATATDLKDIGNELRGGLEKMLPLQNNQLLQFYGVRKDSIVAIRHLLSSIAVLDLKAPSSCKSI